MANKAKTGLDYFPLEVTMFSDIKIRKLIKHQGAKAITVYNVLLCKIYESGYYIKWDNDLPFVISEVTGYDEVYVNEAIKACLNVNLINQDLFQKGIVTSKGIQERFSLICKTLKRKFKIGEYNLIDSEELPNNTEELAIPSEEIPIDSEELPQRKGKEKEEKENKKKGKKEFVPPSLEEFSNYCKENGFASIAEKAFKYYAAGDWKDSNENQVRNWKQKLISVWFKEENKNGSTQQSYTKSNTLAGTVNNVYNTDYGTL